MSNSPEPLPDDVAFDHFTPDATLAWIVAYAGPCGDPACKIDGITGGHTRLFLIPMIGWLHVLIDVDDIRLRPAVMSSGGAVTDYLHMPSGFRFISILRATEDAPQVARELYKERYGEEMILEADAHQAMQN